MLGDNFSDNMRQTGVIVKYELKKQFRGKRIAIFAVIMVLLLALCTILPYAFGDGLSALSPNELARLYMGSMVQLYVILLATLFFASIIVSEFEERTALILFTKPLKKWSVFLGKISAALLIGFAFILIFYAVTAVISLIALGTVTSALLKSLGLALICMVGLGGIAVLMSSVMKKASTASILTFALPFILSMVSGILSLYDIDPWFMIDEAATYISASIGSTEPVLTYAGVMLIWGLVTAAAGYLVFRRREL